MLNLHNSSIDVSEHNKHFWSTDFEALKMWKGRSGRTCIGLKWVWINWTINTVFHWANILQSKSIKFRRLANSCCSSVSQPLQWYQRLISSRQNYGGNQSSTPQLSDFRRSRNATEAQSAKPTDAHEWPDIFSSWNPYPDLQPLARLTFSQFQRLKIPRDCVLRLQKIRLSTEFEALKIEKYPVRCLK